MPFVGATDARFRRICAPTTRSLPTRRFRRLAISPDGRHVVTGGGSLWSEITSKIESDGDYDVHLYRLPENLSGATGRMDSTLQNSLGMTLQLIPAGSFDMGTAQANVNKIKPDDDWFFAGFVPSRRKAETPKHRVSLTKSFYMATHEVSVAQFRQFIEATGYKTTAERDESGYGWMNTVWRKRKEFNWKNPGFKQTDNHPVCNVSWDDAVEFCRWLSKKEGKTYRLPSEAEWEYACRAGTTTLFSTGDDSNSLKGAANLADASLSREQPSVEWAVDWDDGYVATSPVGSFAANAFGLYDMHGNVWEWCVDVYDYNSYESSPAIDPAHRASNETHVFRGGGFDNWPGFLRSADRYSSHSPTLRSQWTGFRVVRENNSNPAVAQKP